VICDAEAFDQLGEAGNISVTAATHFSVSGGRVYIEELSSLSEEILSGVVYMIIRKCGHGIICRMHVSEAVLVSGGHWRIGNPLTTVVIIWLKPHIDTLLLAHLLRRSREVLW
jgi:hypothetical protein